MTLEEAWKKYLLASGESLPWEPDPSALRPAFEAGWLAHREAIKQADLFPGTLSSEQAPYHASCPAGVTGLAHRTCNAEESVRVGCGAEDVYAAFPRKQGKLAALKAITKAAASTKDQGGYEYLLKQTKAFAAAVASWPESEKQFCPMPATFFNQGRYMDDQKLWQRFSPTSQFKEVR